MRLFDQPSLADRDPRFRRVERRFQRVIVAGFTLVLLLMLASGLLGLYAMRSMRQNTRRVSDRYLVQTRLVDDLQRQQGGLSLLLFNMAREPGGTELQRYRGEIEQQKNQILGLIREAGTRDFSSQEREGWRTVEQTISLLFQELKGLLEQHRNNSERLSILQRQLITQTASLMEVSYNDAAQGQTAELLEDENLIENSQRLLIFSWGVAIVSAFACILGSLALFQGLEKQAVRLAKLSVHTLAEQEDAARRFSQEIHDEFSQTLNAIESTLTVLKPQDTQSRTRVEEAVALAKDAQGMAREMSQLLRPRILDDFGLEPGLRELAHGFSRRTGIAVDYQSNLRERLHPSAETHLFRIAQEALTNTSRHTLATNVELSLTKTNEDLTLRIADNGGGLPAERSHSGLGLLGMQERARATGGRFSIESHEGKGLEIRVRVPLIAVLPSTGTGLEAGAARTNSPVEETA